MVTGVGQMQQHGNRGQGPLRAVAQVKENDGQASTRDRVRFPCVCLSFSE